MKFDDFLQIVGKEPLFETGLLLSDDVDPSDVRRQLSRWVATGKVVQLRRGVYVLASVYRKQTPHAFVMSNVLARPSYVSFRSALAFHGLIPESLSVTAAVTTAVTTRRPESLETPRGAFQFRHLSRRLFFGMVEIDVLPGQQALIARPEKALLDLVYLTPRGDRPVFLESLPLQALDSLDLGLLQAYADRWQSPKMERAAAVIAALARIEADE
ncbi:MAG: hypothetical protein J7M25_02035 [Deltaproteobacteria bacterium]|nr:hypothetical protein [Deltaproteobacteria bacterium]